MKSILLKLFLATSLIFITSSCDSDDNDRFPVTLNFKQVDERFLFFQNGAESSEVPEEVLNSFLNSRVSLKKEEFENDSKNDFFKFLSETEIEISEEGDIFKAKYEFVNNILILIGEDGERFVYGEGDMTKIVTRFTAGQVKGENSSGGFSSSIEDEGDLPFFPATFENSKEFHEYDAIEDIMGDESLLLQNLTLTFE
ncbi:hypothetical protein [Aquimarina agarivorans]|uniref:hypothetical protein n=1 Tax=Aquimarina agarivorans TaxID=980584 RepID=UPI000248E775|nr:hypothetical protein [Aquimarina agarivorans]